jgi:hypothetical protein
MWVVEEREEKNIERGVADRAPRNISDRDANLAMSSSWKKGPIVFRREKRVQGRSCDCSKSGAADLEGEG